MQLYYKPIFWVVLLLIILIWSMYIHMMVVKEPMTYDTKVLVYQTMDSITNAESKDKPLLNSLLYTTLSNPTFTKKPRLQKDTINTANILATALQRQPQIDEPVA